MEDIFCRIAKGEIPSNKVYEDEEAIAFLDLSPKTKGHALVLPKAHYECLLDCPAELLGKLYEAAKKVANAEIKVLGAKGFNFISNAKPASGQSVPHFHIHVIPRYGSEKISLEGTEVSVDYDMAELAKEIRAAI